MEWKRKLTIGNFKNSNPVKVRNSYNLVVGTLYAFGGNMYQFDRNIEGRAYGLQSSYGKTRRRVMWHAIAKWRSQ